MEICPCKYPTVIFDKRDSEEIKSIAIPFDIMDGYNLPVPDMEVTEETGQDNVKRKYMKVQWIEPHKDVKRYYIAEHIVLAGCPEENLSCDLKNIYVVYHPIDEWNSFHMIDVKE